MLLVLDRETGLVAVLLFSPVSSLRVDGNVSITCYDSRETPKVYDFFVGCVKSYF